MNDFDYLKLGRTLENLRLPKEGPAELNRYLEEGGP